MRAIEKKKRCEGKKKRKTSTRTRPNQHTKGNRKKITDNKNKTAIEPSREKNNVKESMKKEQSKKKQQHKHNTYSMDAGIQKPLI